MVDATALAATTWPSTDLTNRIERVKQEADLEKACLELESLFLQYLLKQMRATIPESGFLKKDVSSEIYTALLDGEVAKELVAVRGIGLAARLLERLRMDGELMKAPAAEKIR